MKMLPLLILLLVLGACRSSTEYGACIGINDKAKPTLEYKYSGRNIAIGIIFFELVIPPVLVVLNELQCPVGRSDAE